MKKLIQMTKKTSTNAGQKLYSKFVNFALDQRGIGAATKVFSVFTAILLIIVIYVIFKESITTFIQTKVFGKMNSLE